MTHTLDIDLSYAETQTYLCLGLIAANAGWRDAIYKGRKRISNEGKESESNIGAWFLAQGYTAEELDELYKFRNSLFHGRTIVNSDGSVQIDDPECGGNFCSAEQINGYAARFYNIRPDKRIACTFEVFSVCKCGAKFPEPEEHEALLDHIENCAVFMDWCAASGEGNRI